MRKLSLSRMLACGAAFAAIAGVGLAPQPATEASRATPQASGHVLVKQTDMPGLFNASSDNDGGFASTASSSHFGFVASNDRTIVLLA